MASTRRNFMASAAVAGLAIGALAAPNAAIGAPASGPPNILLLFPDQWRPDWMSGNPALPIRTPNLDRLAAMGMRFNKAVSAAPICGPSRACLASGMEYEHQRTPSNSFNYPLALTTVYSRLRDTGYNVLGCGKMDLAKGSHWWGADGKWRIKSWGFSDGVNSAGKWDQVTGLMMNDGIPPDPYLAYLKSRGLLQEHIRDYKARHASDWGSTFPTPLPDDAYSDNWVTRIGIALLATAPPGKPWFMQVNWPGPHEPEDITKTMEASVRGRPMPQVNGANEFDAAKNQLIRQNYTAMCENIDRQVGYFLDHLTSSGQIDNTLVIFASDHGEMLGDHGHWGKSLPYQASVGVPLIVAGKGVARGKRSDALVSLIDVTATMLDYADTPSGKIDGRSFRAVLEGGAQEHRRVVYSGLGPWRMAWDGRFKVITGLDPVRSGADEQNMSRYDPAAIARPLIVFDHQTDQGEITNMAATMPPAAAELLARLNAGGYPE